jgi:hypothetical protein
MPPSAPQRLASWVLDLIGGLFAATIEQRTDRATVGWGAS